MRWIQCFFLGGRRDGPDYGDERKSPKVGLRVFHFTKLSFPVLSYPFALDFPLYIGYKQPHLSSEFLSPLPIQRPCFPFWKIFNEASFWTNQNNKSLTGDWILSKTVPEEEFKRRMSKCIVDKKKASTDEFELHMRVLGIAMITLAF